MIVLFFIDDVVVSLIIHMKIFLFRDSYPKKFIYSHTYNPMTVLSEPVFSLSGFSTDLVTSLMFMKGTSCSVIRMNFK